jgi:hypothetical protein
MPMRIDEISVKKGDVPLLLNDEKRFCWNSSPIDILRHAFI